LLASTRRLSPCSRSFSSLSFCCCVIHVFARTYDACGCSDDSRVEDGHKDCNTACVD